MNPTPHDRTQGDRSQPTDLRLLQQWMLSTITHPNGVASGIDAQRARQLIDVDSANVAQVVTPSRARSSIERLEVYGNAYYARLLDCLASFFPALTATFDRETLDSFTFAYLQQHPPGSYTLNRLADNFVAFLRETKPADLGKQLGWADFMIELAELELNIDSVFDGPGVEGETLLTPEAISQIQPEQIHAARLRPVVCLALHRFQFPVNEFYTAFRENQHLKIPQPGETFLALSRRDFIVRRHALSKPQYLLLSKLQSGSTLGEAIAAAAESATDVDDFASKLHDWFRDWAAGGLFHAIQLAEED